MVPWGYQGRSVLQRGGISPGRYSVSKPHSVLDQTRWQHDTDLWDLQPSMADPCKQMACCFSRHTEMLLSKGCGKGAVCAARLEGTETDLEG